VPVVAERYSHVASADLYVSKLQAVNDFWTGNTEQGFVCYICPAGKL